MNVTTLSIGVSKPIFKIKTNDGQICSAILEVSVHVSATTGSLLSGKTTHVYLIGVNRRSTPISSQTVLTGAFQQTDGTVVVSLLSSFVDGYWVYSMRITTTMLNADDCVMRWSVRNFSPNPLILLV